MYPDRVLAGEYWRVITFLFDPPTTNLIFAVFFWYMFYLMGTTLEVTWGAFRYNMYLLIGYVASLACAFAAYFATGALARHAGFEWVSLRHGLSGVRTIFPDFTFYIMFVIPIKIRWIAMLQWIGYAYAFFSAGGWRKR